MTGPVTAPLAPGAFRLRPDLVPRDVLALQRLAGNRAVNRLLQKAPSRNGLPPEVEAKMEQAFDADFSDVRIRPDSASADALGVRAYTKGSEVHLATGRFQPETPAGQALLGHELAHVVQQRGGKVTATTQARGHEVNDESSLEREAERAGTLAAQGEPARIGGGGTSRPTAAPARPPLQASGIELLKDKDPAADDAQPLRDWRTLKASAGNPTAVDVHQILLTAEKLSDGWKSGMGDVLAALANRYSENEGIPDSEVSFGPLVNVAVPLPAPTKKKHTKLPSGLKGKARLEARGNPKDISFEKRVQPKKRRLQRGSWMKADLLTPKGGAGSDATTAAYVNFGGAVEGHLLNAHLHGPAENKNLAPFSPKLNKTHSAVVEEPLKKMVLNQGRYFKYHVTVVSAGLDKLFPPSIVCDVVEIDAAKQPVADGYEQHVALDQAGNVTGRGPERLTGAPASNTRMSFQAQGGAGAASVALTALWNQLKFPWTSDYGTVMKDVLDTAYLAVRAYDLAHGAAADALAVPRTVVTFTTGHVTNAWDENEDIGVHMVADPLTLRSPASGEVGFQPEGEKWGSGAIKGHLLNHHVHGPAEPKNLAPMSNSLNQQFERDVESHVKRMVLTEGKVLRYEVELTGNEEQFGLDRVPAQLDYTVQEYEPREGVGLDYEDVASWDLEPAPTYEGRLLNNKDTDYEEY